MQPSTIDLLKAELAKRDEAVEEFTRMNKATIEAGTRAQREVDDAKREADEVRRSLAVLENVKKQRTLGESVDG